MGIVANLRSAVAPSAIAQAMRAPRRVARIGTNGPPLGFPMPAIGAGVSLVDYRALGADADEWFSIMVEADRGYTAPMIDMFADARDRDSHLDGVTRKRVQSMSGRPINFRPPEGFENDKEALEIAASVRRIVLTESRQFRSMLAHLMTGAAYSYAVSPLRWTVNAYREHVPHLGWQHCNRFGFDRDSLRLGFYEGRYRSNWRVAPLDEYPDCFVAHVPMGGRSDYPWRRGPIRSCIIPSFIKRRGLHFWLVLAEKFGMPQPYAIVPEGLDHDGESTSDTIATVQAALRGFSTHWSATFSKGVEINSIPGSGAVKADVHKALIDWAEMTTSIAMLGQNLSTKAEGGSFAAVEVHRYVADDLHLADSTELAETITQQVVEPVVRYNFPGAPVPVCTISIGQQRAFSTQDVVSGIASEDEYRRGAGHEPQSDGGGGEYRRPTRVQVPATAPLMAKPGPKPTEAEDPADMPSHPAPDGAVTDIVAEPGAAPVAPAEDIQATALNGAQTASLLNIGQLLGEGAITMDFAVFTIINSFPSISEQDAVKALESIVPKRVEPDQPLAAE